MRLDIVQRIRAAQLIVAQPVFCLGGARMARTDVVSGNSTSSTVREEEEK